jgi:hypothetical protein
VKTNQKIAVLVLSIVFSLTIIIDSVQSGQTNTILKEYDLLLPKGISRFVKENPKYHYVGMEKCASSCHNKEDMGFQYKIMKNGPHSQAFKILPSKKAVQYTKKANVKGDPQESTVCLNCHVTGEALTPHSSQVLIKKMME